MAVINAEHINIWFCSVKDSSCIVKFQGYKKKRNEFLNLSS